MILLYDLRVSGGLYSYIPLFAKERSNHSDGLNGIGGEWPLRILVLGLVNIAGYLALGTDSSSIKAKSKTMLSS